MKPLAGVAVTLLVLLCGCANVTTTKVRKTPTGLDISSGKDVAIGWLNFQDPSNNTSLVISNYSSQANVDAIRAQGDRERLLAEGITRGLAETFAQYLRYYAMSQGVPLPPVPAGTNAPAATPALTGGAK